MTFLFVVGFGGHVGNVNTWDTKGFQNIKHPAIPLRTVFLMRTESLGICGEQSKLLRFSFCICLVCTVFVAIHLDFKLNSSSLMDYYLSKS